MKTPSHSSFRYFSAFFLILFGFLFIASQYPIVPITSFDINWNLYFQIAIGLFFVFAFIGYKRFQKLHQQTERQAEETTQKLRTLNRQHELEKKRLSFVLDCGRLAYWEWDIKNNQAYFSDLWQEMIGFNHHDFPQDLHAWQARIHPLDQEQVQKKLLKLLSHQVTDYEDTHRVMDANGAYIWVYDRGQTITNELGNVEKLSCVRLNITQQKQLEEELTLDKILLENTQEAIAITNENLSFIRTNPAFHDAFGLTQADLAKMTLRDLLDNLQDEPPQDILMQVDKNLAWRGELTLHHINGDLARSSLVDCQKVIHQTTQTTHYALVYTDITELKQTQQELSFLANTDIITGLPNRNYFYQALDEWLETFSASGNKFTLMFLDLDNFKTVNDTLGHDTGDHLLKSVSELIAEHIAEDTLFARVGGDEFVILCRAYTTPKQLNEIGKNLNQLLSQPFNIGNHEIKIGSSIGIALFPDHGSDKETLLKHADQAMYQAKNAGKGRYKIYQAW